MEPPEKSIDRCAKYLSALGCLELVSLNLGGLALLWFASGVAERKQSSRLWVLWLSGLSMIACCVGVVLIIVQGPAEYPLRLFGEVVVPGPPLWLAIPLVAAAAVIWGLPVAWLLSPSVRREFAKGPLSDAEITARTRAGHSKQPDERHIPKETMACPGCGARVNPVTLEGLERDEDRPWSLSCRRCGAAIAPVP